MARGPLNLPFELSSSGLREYWSSRSRPVQLSIIIVGIALVVALVMIAGYFSRPSMEVLFRGLDARQAREVAEKLEEMGMTYELAEDGTAILVPREERDRLRLQLSPDLYAQGTGFALFEGNGVMMSDFERRRQWQIALQEELRRTIVSIDAVEEARVHLVLPEQGVFLREQGTPSASVWLRLNPLVTLTEKQIKGILYLVAGSVENLKPENISLVDSQGNILYDAYSLAEGSAPQAGVGDQMKLKREFERELESRIKNLLERVYGAGKAVAMVTAELDFDRKETTSVSYNDPVPRSEQRTEERSSGEGQQPGGETGESNIPGYDYNIGTGTGEYSYERIEEVINYEVGEVRTYLQEAPGKIMRLSAAVIIDGKDSNEGVIQQVEQLVATAIGQDLARGDTVSVQMLPFEVPDLGDLDEALKSERLRQYIRYGLIAGAGLLVFILALVVILRRPWARREVKHLDRTVFDEFEPEAQKVELGKRERLRKLADEEPEALAQLIKPWLAEE